MRVPLRRRLRRLATAVALSPYLDRSAAWRPMDGNYFAHLQDAQQLLEEVAEANHVSVATLMQCTSEVPVPQGQWQKAQAQVSASTPLCTDATKETEIADTFPARPAGQAPLKGPDAAMIPGQGIGTECSGEQ